LKLIRKHNYSEKPSFVLNAETTSLLIIGMIIRKIT